MSAAHRPDDAQISVAFIHCGRPVAVRSCGLMADHLELWTAPEDMTASVEVAADSPDPGSTTADAGKRRRARGPFLTYLGMPWSYGDRDSSDRWHRLQCRRGRHEMHGGHTMQVDGAVVFIERQCRWCDAGASPSGGF